jgi:eukaryotic-like serine/threonine-protein kinase
MPTERWTRVDEVFTAAAALPAAMRADFLERTCGDDASLRDEISSLLTAAAQSGDFLAAPALDVFARQIASEGWSVRPGDKVASYLIGRRVGAGGIGEVWQATDERLARDVAIKLLLPHPSNASERVRAFQREARAAGSLNHPNVLTVHDVGEHGGAPYLVTEYLEGESLRSRLTRGPLPLDVAFDVALQMARGLAAAHVRGIVHRDLKPENVFLTADGRAKILDFGLATLHGTRADARGAMDGMAHAGTAGYMAPEQVRGDPVDQRADVFAFGTVLSEMLAGRRMPGAAMILQRCLAESPANRFADGGEVAAAIERLVQARRLRSASTLLALVRRPAVAVGALVVIVGVALAVWRWNSAASQARWARTVAGPEIQRLEAQGDLAVAFLLARKALDVLPDDPHLGQLWLDVSLPASIDTDPSGVDVALAPYTGPATSWFALGRTPLHDVRIPRSLVRVRLSKPGFQHIEGAMAPPPIRYRLDPLGAAPPGMVRAVRDPVRTPARLIGRLDDYWIDRFEVTNRQFKAFVDQGGYRRREFWREAFLENGGVLPFDEAIARFHDATGRPGPATWTSGTYRDDEAEFPVGGVSWYEAAAYAAFAGRSLPTIHHWYAAAGRERFTDMVATSNFSENGPARVGAYNSLGPFGTYDMAGNLKEWCSTASDDKRFLLGGAWNEPRYMFGDLDARGPFERASNYGFRLVKYERMPSAEVTAPIRLDALVGARPRIPASDAIFEVYRAEYASDPAPLNAVIEATETADTFLKHTVAFDAAYGGERMRAYLFLPRNASPPYQTVVFFPGGDAFRLTTSRDMSLLWMKSLLGSGRAFLYPVYKGTYERRTSGPTGPNGARDLGIAWSRDLARAIDYLETRPDVDARRLAFYGVSDGANAGVVLVALEPRITVAVFQGAGLDDDMPPELDPVNFAPRVRIPALMLNGRYDFVGPYETAQRPLFVLLGSGAGQKRHVVFETGHALPSDSVAAEMLPWLDQYLGSVVRERF